MFEHSISNPPSYRLTYGLTTAHGGRVECVEVVHHVGYQVIQVLGAAPDRARY
jgi:hypothetical protein